MRIIFILIITSMFFVFVNFGLADATVTASVNFCKVFHTNPECTGWRVEPISDNFWFCEYVDLPTMCKNLPDPQKQIVALDADYCCRLFDDDLISPRDVSTLYYDPTYSQMVERGIMLDESYPLDELVVWTDKDHYDFGDRINVYGKFDFSDPVIKKSNLFVDVVFNGGKVIVDLPVQDNGWFSGFFFLDNPRYRSTGLSTISVNYIHSPTLENPYTSTTSTYQFTTGDVPDPKRSFLIQMSADKFSIGETISYRTEPKNPIPFNLKFTLISRITNPDGITFPLPTNSLTNLDKYMNEISNLRSGNYTITMTVGHFTTNNTFEYK